jgi:very-short-patch-repair endonuclease
LDFLLLLPGRARVLIEVDGREHYARTTAGRIPLGIRALGAEDRKLRLAGYEVYRFGGYELMGSDAEAVLRVFFDAVLGKHSRR